MNQLEIDVRNLIVKHNLINKNDKVIVAFSGGPDSLSLLNILNNIKETLQFEIYAAHLNHMLRGIDAYKDAMFCANFCEEKNIRFFTKAIDINEIAKEKNKGIEETARIVRYNMLYDLKDKLKANKIAVAHNMDDQVETFFLNFFRGSGLNGLKAMTYISNDIIRPLLNVKRNEIERYCKTEGLKPVIDNTNYQNLYRRNKIRLNFIPYIKKNFSENIVEITHRNTVLLSEDCMYLEKISSKIFNEEVKCIEKDKVIFDINNINNYSFSILSRILRQAILLLTGDLKDIEYVHIIDIISLINNSSNNKRINLPKDVCVYKNSDELIISTKKIIYENIDFKYEINLNKSIYIKEINAHISAKVYPKDICVTFPTGRDVKAFDYDKIEFPLFIRNRKNGDKIRPIGMNGSKKISDILIDKKIDNKEKDKYPLIEDNNGILWLWDYRISEEYKIDDTTKNVLRISIKFD